MNPNSECFTAKMCSPRLIPTVFTAAECQGLIDSFEHCPKLPPLLKAYENGAGTGERRPLMDQNLSSWVIQKLMQVAYPSNQEQYGFEIEGMEVPHLIRYHVGQESYRHMDITDENTAIRKLSMLIFLSDPTSYTGGVFSCYPDNLEIDASQGNVLLFPAFLLHQVSPVLSGLRYTLVTWGIGKPFR